MSAMALETNRTADTEAESLATAMIEVAKLTRDLLAMHLATIALSPGEDDYVLALNAQDPMNLNDVAEELGVQSIAAVKSYELLAFRNLVQIRGNKVTLTDSGKETRSKISSIYRMVGEDISGRLSEERLDDVRRSLDDVKKNMQLARKRRAFCN